jgi:hypothetical protein
MVDRAYQRYDERDRVLLENIERDHTLLAHANSDLIVQSS